MYLSRNAPGPESACREEASRQAPLAKGSLEEDGKVFAVAVEIPVQEKVLVYFPSGAYNLGMFTLRVKSSAPISAGKLHRRYKDLSEAVTQAEESLFDYPEITSIEVCDGDRVVSEVRRDSNGKIDKAMF